MFIMARTFINLALLYQLQKEYDALCDEYYQLHWEYTDEEATEEDKRRILERRRAIRVRKSKIRRLYRQQFGREIYWWREEGVT